MSAHVLHTPSPSRRRRPRKRRRRLRKRCPTCASGMCVRYAQLPKQTPISDEPVGNGDEENA
eukprot:1183373-Prorocentrum_minimum.AAC.2